MNGERDEAKRLQAAIITALARHGYASTTVGELEQLAGVAAGAFGQHFDGLEACFLATHDVIVRDALDTAHEVYEREAAVDPAARTRAVLHVLCEQIRGDPNAAALVLVAPQSVGAGAIAHSDRKLAALEGMLNEAFGRCGPRTQASELTAKAIVSGIRRVLAEQVQRSQLRRLGAVSDALADLVARYCPATPKPLPGEPPRPDEGQPPAAGRAGAAGAEAPARERIMRAVAAVSSGQGSAAVNVPSVLLAAGVSEQAFQEHFRDAGEALLASYELATRRALGVTLASFQAAASWPQAIHASIATLLELLAAEPDFARLTFVEILAAGPAASEKAELRFEAFSALLDPGFEHSERPPARVAAGAIAGGIWGVIQHHVLHGLTPWLPTLAPALTLFALTPFIGAERAAVVATEPLDVRGAS